MAVGDIFQATLQGVYETTLQDTNNVFFYRQETANTSIQTDSVSLAAAFYDNMLSSVSAETPLVNIMSAECSYRRLYVINLFEPTDFYDWTFTDPIDGAVGGEFASNLLAWSFRSNRTRRDIRRGFKRFPGVAETQLEGNSITAAAEEAAENIATQLGETIQYSVYAPDSALFAPVVVKRIKEISTEGEITYRLPEDIGEAVYSPASAWEFRGVTSQRTRKA